jgi:nucleoside 2-deoxyribosyltransferase
MSKVYQGYYIAGGFFNETQKNRILRTEKMLDEKMETYFSPRTFVLDLSPNNPEREANAKKLFEKDITEIDKYQKMIVHCDEGFDKGTMFELGYFLGLIVQGERKIEDLEYDPSPEVEKLKMVADVLTRCKDVINATKYHFEDRKESNILIVSILDEFKQNFMDRLLYMNYETFNVCAKDADLLFIKVAAGATPIFLTDEWPFQIFILMGMFYRLGIKFFTASTQNYGSNIMIASSTQGHINLPSLVNPFSNPKKIE